MQTQDVIVMGKVTGAFGVKGWLKVNSFARPPEKLGDYVPWRLCDAGRNLDVELVELKTHGKGLVVRVAGINDRDQAQELSGMQIVVSRAQLPEPDTGHYYWSDLEGLLVKNVKGEALGRVEQLMSAGAADVMLIEGERRILVPFVLNETVLRVDIEAGVIEVDWKSDD
jgi:16S rRNA processing protein RimM